MVRYELRVERNVPRYSRYVAACEGAMKLR
jgi:hypothetical protein